MILEDAMILMIALIFSSGTCGGIYLKYCNDYCKYLDFIKNNK